MEKERFSLQLNPRQEYRFEKTKNWNVWLNRLFISSYMLYRRSKYKSSIKFTEKIKAREYVFTTIIQ